MKRYVLEPGYGSRLDLVYGRIEGTKQYMLAWLHRYPAGPALVWQHDDDIRTLPSPGYIAQKMGIERWTRDARTIAEFIESHHPTRVKETSCEKVSI
mgnify:CR=1 FL=1